MSTKRSELADELTELATRCEVAAAAIDTEPLKSIVKRVTDAIEQVAPSSSSSWIGYHARVYYRGFRRPPAHDLFSSEWGLTGGFGDEVSEYWQEVEYEDVEQYVLRVAGNPDLSPFKDAADQVAALFDKSKEELLATLSALVDQLRTATLEELRDEAKKVKIFNAAEIIDAHEPESFMTSDRRAANQGVHPPHHFRIYAELLANEMPFHRLKELVKIARRAATYIERSQKIRRPSEHRVFVGHGRSTVWKDLRDFLERRLNLQIEEFNSESVAGKTVTDRIDEMLDRCTFAFLVMTGEDEHTDATLHARENVIHETGRAQQKLGSKRAIVLLEEGCKTFSNLQGVVYIEFPKGKIRAIFEDIREVLEREHIITA